jgi:type I restriction enzyme S subunit
LLTAGGDDWVEGKVGDISVLRYGYTESANWDPIGPKFLRITDIQDGLVNWDLVPYCKISDADLSLQQLKDGDLVFARTGATTGKSFLVTNPPDSVSASYLIRLRPDQSKVNPYYLSIFFQSENYWQQVMAGTSGSAQGGVNASKLSHLKIQIPPLSRQKMISDLIEEMDIHASKIREALNRSQNLRSTMLSDLLSGDHEIPASYDKVIGAA